MVESNNAYYNVLTKSKLTHFSSANTKQNHNSRSLKQTKTTTQKFEDEIVENSKDPLWWSHGALQVQTPHLQKITISKQDQRASLIKDCFSGIRQEHYVLPILLQERDKEVDAHLNILKELLLFHGKVTNSNTHTQNLLQLELHSRFGLVHLPFQGLLVTHQSWELSCNIRHHFKKSSEQE